MKYIWKNIKIFYDNKKFIFFIIVFSVLFSCIMIHFSYGLFQNYQLKKQYDLSNQREVRVCLYGQFEEVEDSELNQDETYLIMSGNPDSYVTVDLMKKLAADFDAQFNQTIKYIEATAVVDDLTFRLVFTIENGQITKSDAYQKEIENNAMLESGRYFTEEEYLQGARVAVCWDYYHWNTASSPVSKKMAIDDETLRIQDKDYEIIAYGIIDIDRPTIPLTSLDGDTPFTGEIIFHFKEPIRQVQYDTIVEKTEKNWGKRAYVRPIYLPKDDSIYLYNTIIIITILISVISAINFAILYRYILISRKRALMIYRICGMSFIRIVFLYLGECIFLALPGYIMGVIVFAKVILKQVSKYYEYMNDRYSIVVYLSMFAIYFLASLFILFFMIIRELKTDADLRVEGGFNET